MFEFSIILSQTFYYLENGKKQYLYNFSKTHKVYKNEEIWRKMLDSIINEKSEQFNQIEYKLTNNDEIEKKKKNKLIEIVFAQLIAVSHNMINFDFDLNINIRL